MVDFSFSKAAEKTKQIALSSRKLNFIRMTGCHFRRYITRYGQHSDNLLFCSLTKNLLERHFWKTTETANHCTAYNKNKSDVVAYFASGCCLYRENNSSVSLLYRNPYRQIFTMKVKFAKSAKF